MTRVRASAPGKLMLFGEHSVVYGFPSIVTAVDQRIFVEVESVSQALLQVEASEVGVPDYRKPLELIGQGDIPRAMMFVEVLVANFRSQYGLQGGLRIRTRSEFSALYGFGSSSAVTVALALSLASLSHVSLTKQQLFELCYKTVIDVQGVGSGFDVAAAIWGGTIYYVKPAKTVIELTREPLPVVVGYSGIKADTTKLINLVARAREKNKKKIDGIFSQIEKIVTQAKVELLDGDWKQVGQLMNSNQQLLRELGVSSQRLDTLVAATTKVGAYGAKLSGAGGGDCMLAACDPQFVIPVERAIVEAGGQVVSVKTSAPGARMEQV